MEIPSTTVTTTLPIERLVVAGQSAIYETVLASSDDTWLRDHRVAGLVVVPGAVLAALVRSAARDCFGDEAASFTLTLQAPLVVQEGRRERIQVIVTGTPAGWRAAVHGQRADPVEPTFTWAHHATAEGSHASAIPSEIDLTALRSRCSEPIDVDRFYRELEAVGIVFGAPFQTIRSLARSEREILCEVAGGALVGSLGAEAVCVDAAFQASLAGIDRLYLPFAIRRLTFHRPPSGEAFLHLRLAESVGASRIVDVVVCDRAGRVSIVAEGVSAQTIEAPTFGATVPEAQEVPTASDESKSWRAELAALGGAARRADFVRATVLAEIGRLVPLPAGSPTVHARKALKEIGINSVRGVQLRNALGARVGATLPATLVFDHPTPGAIVDYLLREIDGGDEAGLLAEIERLEARIKAFLASGASPRNVASRLQALATSAGASSPAAQAARSTEADVGGLSDQDLLSLVDATLAGLESKR